ncbi:hypothetical protein DC498_12580 [Terrimonas sp.]|uniref:hypothetical protein n=1 Tax=Terrimonas sp. TaxID=1914338 RepID=UPI000D523DBF|nr:hypothetical protein [Terrimonas sp.]PVD51878.1 hypothetical protein DC498_12580 [Terrimonas sp.]
MVTLCIVQVLKSYLKEQSFTGLKTTANMCIYKYQLLLADSAISGLYNPKFCINPKKNNKIGEATSTNCKAYQSKDKRRVYIYMLNGEGAEQYEVTWIINESNYYRRVIDKIML